MNYSEQENIKSKLSTILGALNFPERRFISEYQITAVVATILSQYFLVDKVNIPFKGTDTPNRDYQGNPYLSSQRYLSEGSEIVEAGDVDLYYTDICAAIANYYAALKVEAEQTRLETEREEINALAFTLFKAATPSNLAYAHWDQVPSLAQRQWQMVAEKAREELLG